MKSRLSILSIFLSPNIFAQSGHLMQDWSRICLWAGLQRHNLLISGALKWNPAAISVFEGRTISLSAGLFMANRKFLQLFQLQWSNERYPTDVKAIPLCRLWVLFMEKRTVNILWSICIWSKWFWC
jgi:hypothetical protein